MPTLFDKVDQFWRGVGEPNKVAHPTRRRSFSSSRPPLPLPPSTKSRNASSGTSCKSKTQCDAAGERLVLGRPPVPTSLPSKESYSGTLDRNRRCYSSLALNGNKSSKSRLTSMSGSIVDIYEFCKSQASRRFSYQSYAGNLKSKNKAGPLSGSTLSMCGYPSIKEDVVSEKPNQDKEEPTVASHLKDAEPNATIASNVAESQCEGGISRQQGFKETDIRNANTTGNMDQ